MKKILILFTLIIAYCIRASGQDWINYTVPAGKNYPNPSMGGSVGDRISGDFILSEDWKCVQNHPSHDTQKLTGVTDLFGSNSIRLGVRRSANPRDTGLVAIAYAHVKGQTFYPAIKDDFGKAIILHYTIEYHFEVYKSGAYWIIELSQKGMRLGSYKTLVSISAFGRRLSSLYIELDKGGAPQNISTLMRITQR